MSVCGVADVTEVGVSMSSTTITLGSVGADGLRDSTSSLLLLRVSGEGLAIREPTNDPNTTNANATLEAI
jgi:hypothetical protein